MNTAMAAMLACCAGACRDQSTPPAALGTPAAFGEPVAQPQMRRGDYWE